MLGSTLIKIVTGDIAAQKCNAICVSNKNFSGMNFYFIFATISINKTYFLKLCYHKILKSFESEHVKFLITMH